MGTGEFPWLEGEGCDKEETDRWAIPSEKCQTPGKERILREWLSVKCYLKVKD